MVRLLIIPDRNGSSANNIIHIPLPSFAFSTLLLPSHPSFEPTERLAPAWRYRHLQPHLARLAHRWYFLLFCRFLTALAGYVILHLHIHLGVLLGLRRPRHPSYSRRKQRRGSNVYPPDRVVNYEQ